MELYNILKAFVVGLVFGLAFTLLKLPIPAPDKLEGVVGIIGIFVGYLLVKMFL